MKRRNDIILIGILILGIVSLFIFNFFRQNNTDIPYVNIYSEDKLLYSVPLEQNREIVVNGAESKMTIVIKNGRVSVKESGCSNQICVHEGEKYHYNDTITCLPNKIYIKIGSKQNVTS